MNAGPATSPASTDDGDLRCAEYVLGVLDAAGRRQVEDDVQHDPRMAQSMVRWQQRLLPLSEDIGTSSPPSYVWTRIQSELGFVHAGPTRPVAGTGANEIWNNLDLWRWLGIGATVAALAMGAVSLLTLHRLQSPGPATTVAGADYRVANISRPDGVVDWTATIDIARGNLVIVPANAARPASDRATELWLIPPGASPLSLGIIAADRPATVPLTPATLARLVAGSVLAVSLEPMGGSPTGQPTGPVLATGPVRGT